jgi:hypothetical protein
MYEASSPSGVQIVAQAIATTMTSVQNEAFCLTLAKRMRIPTPKVTTGRAGKRTYLLVKRYDRTEVGGRCRRLHQEDYCQALGKPLHERALRSTVPPLLCSIKRIFSDDARLGEDVIQ